MKLTSKNTEIIFEPETDFENMVLNRIVNKSVRIKHSDPWNPNEIKPITISWEQDDWG